MSETKLPTQEEIARQIDPDAFEDREKASFWGAEAIVNGRIEKALKSADVILAYFTPSPKHMSTPSTQPSVSVDETAKDRHIAELEAEVERLKAMAASREILDDPEITWQIVPIHPTPKMLAGARNALRNLIEKLSPDERVRRWGEPRDGRGYDVPVDEKYTARYHGMLLNAPKPPTTSEDKLKDRTMKLAREQARATAAESALKASCEIADGLAGALRVFGKAAEDLDNPYCHPLDRAEDGMSIETAMWEHTQPTVGDLRAARQALLAYDAARITEKPNED